MPINWKSPENNERLLACLFASLEEGKQKIDYHRIAELFGQGATYNAIECNFRKIKAAAKGIKKEVEDGSTPSAPTSTPSKPQTPKKDTVKGVQHGRIEKSTPSKKRAGHVKLEDKPMQIFEDVSASTGDGGVANDENEA